MILLYYSYNKIKYNERIRIMNNTTDVTGTSMPIIPVSEHLSPYGAAKIVNLTLAEMGVDKKVPPQMMYNYVRQNILPTYELDGKKYLRVTEFRIWLEKYTSKMVTKNQ
jgi:hypothetical protein